MDILKYKETFEFEIHSESEFNSKINALVDFNLTFLNNGRADVPFYGQFSDNQFTIIRKTYSNFRPSYLTISGRNKTMWAVCSIDSNIVKCTVKCGFMMVAYQIIAFMVGIFFFFEFLDSVLFIFEIKYLKSLAISILVISVTILLSNLIFNESKKVFIELLKEVTS